MNIIHVFSCKNSGVIQVIFLHKLKNKNSGVRFQERGIPVKGHLKTWKSKPANPQIFYIIEGRKNVPILQFRSILIFFSGISLISAPIFAFIKFRA